MSSEVRKVTAGAPRIPSGGCVRAIGDRPSGKMERTNGQDESVFRGKWLSPEGASGPCHHPGCCGAVGVRGGGRKHTGEWGLTWHN